MDIKGIIICILFLVVGIILMWNNRFYRRSSTTMLFPAELKLFLSGLILSLIGGWGIVVAIL